MQKLLVKVKNNPVISVSALFTFLCFVSPLSNAILALCFLMWVIIPIFMKVEEAFDTVVYMSLYARVFLNVKLFASIVCMAILLILIKSIIKLNKNKLSNKYLKIFLIYGILITLPLIYDILLKNKINIQLIYYFNMINLLFLIYLLKDKINYKTIIIYAYGIIISSVIALVSYGCGLYNLAFDAGNRFCAYIQLCNTLGVVCSVTIASIFVLLKNNKISTRQSTILIALLSVIGGMTLSKNFLIMWIIIMLCIFAIQIKDSTNKKKILLRVVLIGFIVIPIALYYGKVMLERFLVNQEYANLFDIITTGRLEKWLIYLKPWCKKLYSIVFGLGLNYNYHVPNSSHSLYVGYLSRLGIVGLVMLLAFIYLIVFRKNNGNLKLRYLPMIIILIICLAEDLSFNTFNFIPFMMAIIPAVYTNKDY